MGKSQSIAEMESKETEYNNYICKITEDLKNKSATYLAEMEKRVNDYYINNKYDKTDFIFGQNIDFMQASEWSLDNVAKIIDVVAKAVFGNISPPSGVKITHTDELSKALSDMEDLEVYITAKCFEVITGIIDSFGNASSVSFNYGYKDEALGNGLHLFVTVVCNSYQSTSFFNNNKIYQYIYIYDVKYSVEEAETQAKIEITKLYEDQIAAFICKSEQLLKALENDDITSEQYQSQSSIYDTLIEKSKAQLEKLHNKFLSNKTSVYISM